MKDSIIIAKKNIRRIIRSKTSLSVIILGPFILVLILGFAFNNSGLYGIRVGVYSRTNGNELDSLIDRIKENDFSVRKYSTLQDCINSVQMLDTHICIESSRNKGSLSLKYYVDYSNSKLVFILIDMLSNSANLESKELSKEMVGELLSKVKEMSSEMSNKSAKMSQVINELTHVSSKITELQNVIAEQKSNTDINLVPEYAMLQSQREDVVSLYNSFYEKSIELKQDLSQQSSNIDTYAAKIKSRKSKLQKLKASLDETKSALACADNYDMSNYIEDDNAFRQAIITSDNPTCAVVVTTDMQIAGAIYDLEQAENDLATAKSEIEKAKDTIEDMQDDINNKYESALTRIDEASNELSAVESTIKNEEVNAAQKKAEFTNELEKMAQSVNANMADFNTILAQLSQIQAQSSAFDKVDASTIVEPIQTEIKSISTKQKTLSYIFPSLLMMMITYITILLGATIEIKENAGKTINRNLMSPAKWMSFLLGTYIASVFITMVEVLVLLIVGQVFFGVDTLSNVIQLIFFVLLASITFSSIGIAIGSIVKNEETGTLLSIIVSFMFLLLSNTVLPIENMAAGIASIAKLSPYYLFETIFRRVLLFGANLESMLPYYLLAILNIGLIFFVVALIYFNARKNIVK
ncbi:MAG: ABC transporter permease [archaeon]